MARDFPKLDPREEDTDRNTPASCSLCPRRDVSIRAFDSSSL